MEALLAETRWVIIGAGFAGAATAWALGRLKLGPGIIFEQEPTYGVHASGRNAGLLRMAEDDPVIRVLARRSIESIRQLNGEHSDLLRFVGGLTLAPREFDAELDEHQATLQREGLATELLSRPTAVARWPFLADIGFHTALWCPEEGVIDIHALLTHYLLAARGYGFTLQTDCRVDKLILAGGRVVGVRVDKREVRADAVVDATGAWAGRLGRAQRPLPLQPSRRHLFVSGVLGRPWPYEAPFVWMWPHEFYCRPEGAGLLLSPCDQTPAAPGTPSPDPGAAELLAAKLSCRAPSFEHLTIRRTWACLRTFAPDRRPVIGPDPEVPGLFHVSGLGGFGVTASAAIGELAACAIAGQVASWIEVDSVSPARLASASRA